MGTKRRYADAIDRRMDEKVLFNISRGGPLQSLTAAELRLDQMPLTIDPQPGRKVKAWVRFGDVPIRVDALVVRRTPDAVGIVFTVEDVELRCWVWASAVDEA